MTDWYALRKMAHDDLAAAKVRLRRTLAVIALATASFGFNAANFAFHFVSPVVTVSVAVVVLVVVIINGANVYAHRNDWKRTRDARLSLTNGDDK